MSNEILNERAVIISIFFAPICMVLGKDFVTLLAVIRYMKTNN